jgi:uncharacterized protein (DUF934 family)
MPLLKGDRFVDETWIAPGKDDALPAQGDVLVPFARLAETWNDLAKHPGLVGVIVPNTERPEALQPYLSRLSLIVLPFPAFTDGRAYSLARRIRDLGYEGELRAAGNVLPDQLQFMLQVGFDAFEVPDRFPESVWKQAVEAMRGTYQQGAGRLPIWKARHPDLWPEQPHAG